MMLDALSIVGQATSLVAWPLAAGDWSLFTIPLSIILVSFGWWENYMSEDSPIPFISTIGKNKKEFPNGRYLAYAFLSVWKCLLFLGTVAGILYLREGRVQFLFEELYDAFENHVINITEVSFMF